MKTNSCINTGTDHPAPTGGVGITERDRAGRHFAGAHVCTEQGDEVSRTVPPTIRAAAPYMELEGGNNEKFRAEAGTFRGLTTDN